MRLRREKQKYKPGEKQRIDRGVFERFKPSSSPLARGFLIFLFSLPFSVRGGKALAEEIHFSGGKPSPQLIEPPRYNPPIFTPPYNPSYPPSKMRSEKEVAREKLHHIHELKKELVGVIADRDIYRAMALIDSLVGLAGSEVLIEPLGDVAGSYKYLEDYSEEPVAVVEYGKETLATLIAKLMRITGYEDYKQLLDYIFKIEPRAERAKNKFGEDPKSILNPSATIDVIIAKWVAGVVGVASFLYALFLIFDALFLGSRFMEKMEKWLG